MARKKNRAGKSPPHFHSARLLPVLGWLTLALAWLAALGGFSDGTAHIQTFMNTDAVRLHIFFREVFERDAPLSSLTAGAAPYYFPDMFAQWALFALGAGTALALCVYPLIVAALSAAGWVLLCDRLFGKSPVRRAAVPLLHSLPFLFLAWDNADIFHSQMMGAIHHSVVAALPWLLWLTILILFPAQKSGRGRKSAAPFPVVPAIALFAALALMSASDLLVVPQFAAPACLCAMILAARGNPSWRETLMFFVLAAAGIVGGRILNQLSGIDTWDVPPALDFQNLRRSLALLLAHFGNGAVRNPLAAAAWAVFVGIAVWRALAVLLPNWRWNIPAFAAVPSGGGHSLVALFVPATMSAAFLTPVSSGLVADSFQYASPVASTYEGVMFSIRYALPVIFLPLFAGWALLPGGIPKFGRFGGRVGNWALVACAMLAVFSVPKAARINFAALDPFATPFQKCFAENAKRLDWRGGVTTLLFARLPLVHPDAEVERLLPIGVFRRPEPGQSFMVVEHSFSRRAVNGEFDFVLANYYNGKIFNIPPMAGDAGCAVDSPDSCFAQVNNFVLDKDSAIAAFGEPREEINCAGVGLLHYDPPLKFDFSARDHLYLAPVTRW